MNTNQRKSLIDSTINCNMAMALDLSNCRANITVLFIPKEDAEEQLGKKVENDNIGREDRKLLCDMYIDSNYNGITRVPMLEPYSFDYMTRSRIMDLEAHIDSALNDGLKSINQIYEYSINGYLNRYGVLYNELPLRFGHMVSTCQHVTIGTLVDGVLLKEDEKWQNSATLKPS